MNTINFFKENLKTSLKTILTFFLINIIIFILYFLFIAWNLSNEKEKINLTASDLAELIKEGASEEEIKSVLNDAQSFYFILNEDGKIVQSMFIPDELNHEYSLTNVASFTRWYLDDYPVFTHILSNNHLLVLGLKQHNLFRYNLYMTVEQLFLDIFFIPVLLIGNCIFFIYLTLRQNTKLKKELEPVFDGINDLKKGEKLFLSEDGLLGEMKKQLNESSRIINNREASRFQWISGVSHDIRTPLSIILTNAELAHNQDYKYSDPIYNSAKQIKELIETLNMENRLFYGTERFKLVSTRIFPLVQETVISIINSQLEEDDWIDLKIDDLVKEANIKINSYLFNYLLENLLINIKKGSKKVLVQVLDKNEKVQIVIKGKSFKMNLAKRSDELSKKVILEIMRILNGNIHSRNNENRFIIILQFPKLMD